VHHFRKYDTAYTKQLLKAKQLSYICSMKHLCFVLCLFLSLTANAQEPWSLQQCVEYAVTHNIGLQQSTLNKRLAEIQVQDQVWSQYPNVQAGFTNGLSVGRSIDPTSNQFVSQAYYFNGLSVNSNVLLFGWFAKRHQIAQSKLDVLANQSQIEQLQNDIGLNVAVAYLRVLLAKEQIRINETQLKSDQEQLALIQKRVSAGQLPELNAAQLRAQVSGDSAAVLNSELDVRSALLDMRALLNLKMDQAFDVAVPNIQNALSASVLYEYPNARAIYEEAIKRQPRQLANIYKLQSAQESAAIAERSLYPTLSLGASLGTNFASVAKTPINLVQNGEEVLGQVKFGDTSLDITRPTYDYDLRTIPFFNQYGQNLRQTLSLNINAPIFNGYMAKHNIERAKIGVQMQELTAMLDNNKLEQDIFKAYNDAESAMQKFKLANTSLESAALALQYADKRLKAGLLNTQEFINQQNTYQRAQVQVTQAKYEAIFKLKVLDFYLGKKIQL
jgi:outer membrane protein